MTKKVLLVGESWTSAATHYKGFDQFSSVTFHLGAEPFVALDTTPPSKLATPPDNAVPEPEAATAPLPQQTAADTH